nr:DUF86 domain-containing protein [Candidatus Sigynarchaeum springense]
MEVDALRVKEKFAFVEKYVAFTRRFLTAKKDLTKWDLEVDIQAQRLFEIISQVFLDVGTHIIAHSKNVAPPSTYAECMLKLAEIGIIAKNDAEKYAKLAQMRNIIAHNYMTIDRSKLQDGLREIIKDIDSFRKAVFHWLDTKQ